MTAINHLHCRYRLPRHAADGWAIARRLDEMAGNEMADAFSKALHQTIGDDPTVYVVRRIRARLTVPLSVANRPGDFASKWGHHLAAAVVQSLANGQDLSTCVARFDNEADYVAHFLSDLVRGRAEDAWYYTRFKSVAHLSVREATMQVLLEPNGLLAEVLQRLYQQENLDRVLSQLGKTELLRLWSEGILESGDSASLALEPLVDIACQIAAHLQLVRANAFLQIEDQAWRKKLVDSYLASSHQAPDWQDSRSLSLVVLDLVRFLTRRDVLGIEHHHQPAKPSRLKNNADLIGDSNHPHDPVNSAWIENELLKIKRVDWLETKWLSGQLYAEFFRRSDEASKSLARHSEPPSSPMRNPHTRKALEPTAAFASSAQNDEAKPIFRAGSSNLAPRQREMLRDLASVIRSMGFTLRQQNGFSAADAMRLHSMLVAKFPRWIKDSMAASLIHQLLTALVHINAATDSSQVIALLRSGRITEAMEYAKPEIQSSSQTPFLLIAAVLKAEPGLEQLIHDHSKTGHSDESSETQPEEIVTDAGGIFLLVRSLMDMRFSEWAVKEIGTDGFAGLLASIALRWSGIQPAHDGSLDAGIHQFVGPRCPNSVDKTRETLRDLPINWHVTLQRKMFDVLRGQRILDVDRIHLYQITHQSQRCLVLGDASCNVWTFGKYLNEHESPTSHLLSWLNMLSEYTGTDLNVYADAELSGSIPLDIHAQFVPVDGDGETRPDVAEHRTSRERLTQTLAVFSHDHAIRQPDLDLSVSLAANTLIRIWSRWLRNFRDSGTPYLLDHMIRRSGRLSQRRGALAVELEPKPLDVILEIAGYLDEIEAVPWLDKTRVAFVR